MINALKEMDQKVALAAAEFWSGIALSKSENGDDPSQEVMDTTKEFLPK
jgi:hypothetical protein